MNHYECRRTAESINNGLVLRSACLWSDEEVQAPDKGQNLERLCKYLKLFSDRVDPNSSNGGPMAVNMDFMRLAM
jgi:hypothetical protein